MDDALFEKLVDGLIDVAKEVATIDFEYRESLKDAMERAEQNLMAARNAVIAHRGDVFASALQAQADRIRALHVGNRQAHDFAAGFAAAAAFVTKMSKNPSS